MWFLFLLETKRSPKGNNFLPFRDNTKIQGIVGFDPQPHRHLCHRRIANITYLKPPDNPDNLEESCCENVFWCSILCWCKTVGWQATPRLLSFVFIGYQGHPCSPLQCFSSRCSQNSTTALSSGYQDTCYWHIGIHDIARSLYLWKFQHHFIIWISG